MNPKLKPLIIGIVIIMSMISGCVEEPQQNDKSINTSSYAPFFPVQNNQSEFSMTALLKGELVLENGCLRVKYGNDNHLLVWPYGFSLSTEGGVIQVIDDTGQPIARVGDSVKFGGGECVEPCNIAGYSDEFPTNRCSGPYWIVGEVLTSDLN